MHPSRQGLSSVDAGLALAPVYSAVRLIAEGVGKLPVNQYRDTGTRKVKMPAGPLITAPSNYLRPFDWKVCGVTMALLHGMAYALITSRDGYGNPTSAEWLPSELVTVIDSSPYNPMKAKFYYAGRPVNREDLFIIRGLTVAGRTEAISPLRAFQSLIESGHNALEYGNGWYRSGGFPPGVFKNVTQTVTAEQSTEIKKRLVRAIRTHEPLVIGSDWEFSPITVPPNEAQFIQSMQLNATQVAAIYGIPPERIGGSRGDSLTYSTQEQESISLITDTLDPWLVRFEEAYSEALPQPQVAEFDRDARIRHDITTRYGVYRTARDIGLFNVNELRELEDREPLPKATTPGAYDGADWTPLQVMVSAARGIKEVFGEGDQGAAEVNPLATSGGAAAAAAGEPFKVPAGTGSNGNGNRPPPAPAVNGKGRK